MAWADPGKLKNEDKILQNNISSATCISNGFLPKAICTDISALKCDDIAQTMALKLFTTEREREREKRVVCVCVCDWRDATQ